MTAPVVDVHAHLWTHTYLDLLTESGITGLDMYQALGATDEPDDLARRFAQMGEAGIDLQILSATPLVPHLESAAAASAAARHVNDEYARLVERHPDRFRAFLALPLPHVDEALTVLDRLAEEAFVGVAITTDILGTALTDTAFDPLFAALDERAATALIHPVGADARSPLIAQRPMRWSVGAPIEDTIAMADLLLTGHLARFPHLRVIGTHLGGALPMFLPRLRAQQPWEAPGAPEPPDVTARRAWFDTVTHVNPAALRAAAAVLGADRLVLGTDYPFQAAGELLADVAQHDTVLTAVETRAVRVGNADALFDLRWTGGTGTGA